MAEGRARIRDREARAKARDREEPLDSESEDEDGEESLRQRVEESLARLFPDLVKRTVEAGWGTFSRADTRKMLSFVNEHMPRDVARYILEQVDDTKNALLRVFAREVREFLEHTDLAEDMRKVLTSVSLEVSTRVRFVPNDDSPLGVKPEVVSAVKPTERRKAKRGKASSEDTGEA